MSSHHIVREKQEPALLVLGLEDFDEEQLGQLLEWSPTLMATNVTAKQLNSQGIKIDWIVTNDSEANLQSDIKHLHHGHNSILAAALSYLSDKDYPAVNVVTDAFDLEEFLPFADRINLVIFHQQEKIYRVTPGFSKWKPAGETIRLLSSPKNLITVGLNQAGDLTYITQEDGFIKLDFSVDALFIAEKL